VRSTSCRFNERLLLRMPMDERTPRDDESQQAIRTLSELIASSDDPFLLTDIDGTILHANRAARDHHQLPQIVRQQMPRFALSSPGAHWRGEVAVDNGDSVHTFDVQVVCTDTTMAIHARDISSSVRLQRQLAHLASHDALTDLPNRTHLLRRLTDAIERSRARQENLSVFYVDIDDLKRVNDTVGHEYGDALIATIGRRLVAATRPGDLVARIGGDEFVILCEDISDERSATELAERIRQASSGHVHIPRADLPKIDLQTSVSVGVVMYRGGESETSIVRTAEALLRDADTAMYRAKMLGKARCELYTEDMRTAEQERSRLIRDFEHAVEGDELFLVHQPIVSPYTQRIVAAEALVRWRHPELGVLQPASFITVAMESSTGAAMDRWVIEQAATSLRRWLDQGRLDGHFAIHVNVSRPHVIEPDFVESVMESLAAASLRTSQLVLEFEESLVLDDDGRAVRALQSIRRRGVRLSLDDFGAGTSSLTVLRTCPVDFVKLDGSLVRDLGEVDTDEPIVRSMIQLAHGFDASVIAESVTTAVHVERLVSLGCDLVQGFHIGEPVSAADFATGTATVFRA
jgi:diguanylate cyclase (GGDEF)-like protein